MRAVLLTADQIATIARLLTETQEYTVALAETSMGAVVADFVGPIYVINSRGEVIPEEKP
jgi:hypothetical protein